MTRKWLAERRKEHYYRKAKKEDLRSRAAFKLLQLNEKYSVIKSGDRVLDLGAAPGGWLKVIKQLVGEEGLVVGVDIEPIKSIEGVITLVGDITKPETVNLITNYSEEFDVITSDCSPNVSGNWSLDHIRQIYLAEKSLEICGRLLKADGNFVVKLFQGEAFEEYLKKARFNFKKVILTKPPASRKKSSEIYLIGKLFKGQRS